MELNKNNTFAYGESNWDYGVVYYSDSSKPYLRSVPKEGTGCRETGFGDLAHVCRLIREGLWDGIFTELGDKLMRQEGYGDVLDEYHRLKTYRLTFFDSSRHYGKITRTVDVACHSRSQAMTVGHEIIDREKERDMIAEYVA